MKALSPIACLRKDSARNTFFYTYFLATLAGTSFSTYAVYQLQYTGFLIGTDADGQPCTTYCIVPWGKQRLDLNSVILYMNALTFALSGVVVILVIAYADFWKRKTLLVTITMVIYAASTVPAYWLKAPTLSNFNALFSLYIVFGILTSILMAILGIYIPHCMREVALKHSSDELSQSGHSDAIEDSETGKARKYGFVMSLFGNLSTVVAGILILAVAAALTGSLSGESGQSAGLLLTTIIGFITVAGSAVCYLGLPELPAKAWPTEKSWKSVLKEPFRPFKMLWQRKNMMFLLLAYTAYTDTSFALYSILGQLYYAHLQPSTLEFTLYTLAGNVFIFLMSLVFFTAQRKLQLSLEKSLIFSYALILLVPLWGVIGIAPQDSFGDKHRWEFYVQSLILSTSACIANSVFRLLYAELIPAGEEVMWFGIQVVLSSATTWITYVATGPLQDRTHNLRFPLLLCFIFLLMPVTLEILRNTLRFLKEDKLRWQAPEKTAELATDPLALRDAPAEKEVGVSVRDA